MNWKQHTPRRICSSTTAWEPYAYETYQGRCLDIQPSAIYIGDLVTKDESAERSLGRCGCHPAGTRGGQDGPQDGTKLRFSFETAKSLAGFLLKKVVLGCFSALEREGKGRTPPLTPPLRGEGKEGPYRGLFPCEGRGKKDPTPGPSPSRGGERRTPPLTPPLRGEGKGRKTLT